VGEEPVHADVLQKSITVAWLALGFGAKAILLPHVSIVIGLTDITSSFIRILRYWRDFYRLCRSEGIVFNLDRSPINLKAQPSGICDALVTEHCADTNRRREALIAAAKHNILISGGYCGGNTFIRFLDLVEQRVREDITLKVLLLYSPSFVYGACGDKAKELARLYPRNVSLIKTPLVWHLSPGLKKAGNHVKCTVIDYGKYFIIGGSCIKDNFADDGLDGSSGPRSDNSLLANVPDNQAESFCRMQESQNLVERLLLPTSFRDMDFVFSSTGSEPERAACGQQAYKEMLLLAYRWEQYNLMLAKKARRALRAKDMGVLTGRKASIAPTDSLTVQLLKTPIPSWESITTKVESFDSDNKKAEGVVFKLLASGPESTRSSFAAELVRYLDAAQKRVVINHMYFHPSREVTEALVRAARRGVRITIITCGEFPDSPGSFQTHAVRNKYNYVVLAKALQQDEHCRLRVYEFRQNGKSTHKKVIIIDDVVLAGSSNLGYKSLVSTSDHELDFCVRSRRFAAETFRVCQVDMEHSVEIIEIGNTGALAFVDYVKAFLHRCLAPLLD
jgi:phosphatidylserine/phosphatidylglycerophosphate/cardiolipin synthase-like enzyme